MPGRSAGTAGRVLLDGRDVTEEIRTPEVSEAASRVAADPGVREALVATQRELIVPRRLGGRGTRHRHRGRARRRAEGFPHRRSPRARAQARGRARRRPGRRCWPSRRLRDERDSTASTARCGRPGAVMLDTTGLTRRRGRGADRRARRAAAAADTRSAADSEVSARPPRAARPASAGHTGPMHEGRHRRLSQRGQVLADQPPHRHARGGRARAPGRHARPQRARVRVERAPVHADRHRRRGLRGRGSAGRLDPRSGARGARRRAGGGAGGRRARGSAARRRGAGRSAAPLAAAGDRGRQQVRRCRPTCRSRPSSTASAWASRWRCPPRRASARAICSTGSWSCCPTRTTRRPTRTPCAWR